MRIRALKLLTIWAILVSGYAIAGAGGNPAVARTQARTVNEQQVIRIIGRPTGGTFTLTFRKQTTGRIPFNSNAQTVKAALSRLSTLVGANVTVTGGPGTRKDFIVQFAGKLSKKDVPSLVAKSKFVGGTNPSIRIVDNANISGSTAIARTVDEQQIIRIIGRPTGGSFTLSFGGRTTRGIPYNSNAKSVQSALSNLATLIKAKVTVSGGPGPLSDFVVQFAGDLSKKDVTALIAKSNLRGGMNPSIQIIDDANISSRPGTIGQGGIGAGADIARSAADVIIARINAQSDLIKAQAEANKSFAESRKLHAEATSVELDNWVKHVRAYWDTKIIRQTKIIELDRLKKIRQEKYLNDQKDRNKKLWDRIKNHPELTQAAVPAGNALNFLLNRLKSTALSYEFARPEMGDISQIESELQLPENLLSRIMLRQRGQAGSTSTFRADDTSGLDLQWWPYALRAFETKIQSFEDIRDAIVLEHDKTGKIGVSSLQHLETSLMSLSQEFYKTYGGIKQQLPPNRYFQFRAAENFIRDLDRQVVRIQNTGDIGSLRSDSGFDPERNDQNLISFLTYLNRNGLEFSPSLPGQESSYFELFAMMRDLYVTVAKSDEGTRSTTRGIDQPRISNEKKVDPKK